MMRQDKRMPAQFQVLATYNAEVSRGIVHTAEFDARMADLQEQFNEYARAKFGTA